MAAFIAANTVPIILVVLIITVILMVLDKLPFGFAPTAACALLALLGVAPISTAFSGFINEVLLLTASLMIVNKALRRTPLFVSIQSFVTRFQDGKSGAMLLLMLLMTAFLVKIFLTPDPTTLLMMTIVFTLPSTKRLSHSQMVLPTAIASDLMGSGIPFCVVGAMNATWINGFLADAGAAPASLGKWALVGVICMVVGVSYALIFYRRLPQFPMVAQAEGETNALAVEKLSKRDSIVTYVVFGLTVLALLFGRTLGVGYLMYVIPIVGVLLLCSLKIITWQNVRSGYSTELVFMLGGMFGLSAIMAESGIMQIIGDAIGGLLGSNPSPWIVMVLFAFIPNLVANLTSVATGTVLMFTPIAIATAMSLGINPVPIAIVTAMAGGASSGLPMGSTVAIASGYGYKMKNVLTYSIPLQLLHVTTIVIATGLIFGI